MFSDDGNGVAELLSENHFYSFGLQMNGDWNQQTNPEQNYLFTGFERQHDFGLNLDMAQFRTFDPASCRWLQIDPMAQEMSAWSPYNYGFNNPVKYTDPDGRIPILPALAVAWAAVEVGLAVYDAYDVATTVMDPNASGWDKAISIGGATLGALLPGGGYSAADDAIKIVDDVADNVVKKVFKEGGDAKKAAKADIGKDNGDWKGPTDYSGIKDPSNLNASSKPTPRQVREMKKANREHNDGLLRDDVTGEIMVPSKKSMRGQKDPPQNEAQIDHIKPINKGGDRSNQNLQMRTRKNNRDKWDN